MAPGGFLHVLCTETVLIVGKCIRLQKSVDSSFPYVIQGSFLRPALLTVTSDLLAGGDSARLYERLVKRKRLFATVNAYISGDVDCGTFCFTGQLLPSTTEAEAEAAFWEEIKDLQNGNITDYELEKVKNKFEANTLFGELNVMNKAMNLGYYEMIGDLDMINREVEIYRSLDKNNVADFSLRIFRPENSSTLIYRAKTE